MLVGLGSFVLSGEGNYGCASEVLSNEEMSVLLGTGCDEACTGEDEGCGGGDTCKGTTPTSCSPCYAAQGEWCGNFEGYITGYVRLCYPTCTGTREIDIKYNVCESHEGGDCPNKTLACANVFGPTPGNCSTEPNGCYDCCCDRFVHTKKAEDGC